MRISKVAQRANIMQAELRSDIDHLWYDKYPDLTYVEYLQVLTELQQSALKYMLRAERHPDDPDKPADLE